MLFFCTACLHNQLNSTFLDKFSNQQSKFISKSKILIDYQSNFDPVLGHQYALFLIPFGKNTTSLDLKTYFSQFLELNHYLVINNSEYQNIVKNGQKIDYQLQLSIDRLKLNAFDLFFMRRIVCEMDLLISLSSLSSGQTYQEYITQQEVDYFPFAFSTQLNHTFENCLFNLSEQLLEKLKKYEY